MRGFGRAKDKICGGISPGVAELAKTKVLFPGQDRYVPRGPSSKPSQGERGTTRTRHSPAVKGSLRRAQLVAAPCRRALLLLYPQVEPARECEEAREVHRGERRPRHERSWEGKGAARQREEDGGGLVRVRVRVANPNPNPNSKPKPNPNPNSNQGRPGGVEHCEGA